MDKEGGGTEAKSIWVALYAGGPGEEWWGTAREKAGSSTAPVEEEERAAQQHSLLHLNVSKVASTKRMPPEGGENKQSVRTSWQLEKKQLCS